MQKNTSGQKIGAQMVSATDGSAFTGSVTVAVTIDAGTQATGSVGSGACTHEGNGYHTYAPSQAETDGKLIAFTFTGSGAVPVTVQVFTRGFDESAAVVPANVTQFGGTNGTFASGRPEVNTTHVAGTSQTAKDLGALNVTTVNTLAGHDPGETIMGATDLGTGAGFTSLASASALSTLQGNVTTLLARVTSTLFDGITSLAEWLGLLAGKQAGDSTALSEIKATGAGSGTYDPTTDSQEAIRDRGDAAWLTATGFSTADPLDAAGVRAAVGLASADLDDQLAALATASALSTSDGKIDTLTTRLGAPADFGGGQSIAANLQDMVGSATYDPSTDSLESLRDRGDAAWATADVSDLATAASVAALPSAADVADAVWDETAADHDTDGSTGAALADAGGAGTPPTAAEIADAVWDEALSGHTDDGTAGDTLGNVATGTPPTAAAIADAVLDEALSGHATAGTLGKAVSDTSTAAAAIQAKTDNLPASPAAIGAAMTLTAAYDAAKTAAQAGDAMALTSGERTTLAGVVWAALTSALTTAGSIGKKLAGLVLGSDDKVVVSADAHTSGETVTAVAGAVGSVTGDVGGSVASVTGDVGGDVVGTIGGLSTQAKADVNAEADSAISDAALATAANLATAKSVIDAVKAKTDNLPDSPAESGEAATALSDVGLTSTITERIDAAISTRATPADIPAAPDVPTAAENAAAVLAAAADDPIDANIQAINDTAIDGDGSADTPWKPAA